MSLLTIVSVIVILGVALCYLQGLLRLWGVARQIRSTDGNLESVSKVFVDLDNVYNRTLNVDINGNNKTLHHADEYYNISEIARVKHINLKHIYSASGVLSGLGVLGTFVGLTVSVSTFDSADSLAIMTSIKMLLGGMGTAFITSLVGMALSAIYIMLQKSVLNAFENALSVFTSKLDRQNYISADEVLLASNERLKSELNNKLSEIQESLLVSDGEGEVSVGNMLYNLYEESEKQSQALESFTTDLSNELNASLGKTMDVSIVPLIQSLERSHDIMNEKIAELSNNITSPATDFVTTAITSLQTTMQNMAGEFKEAISTQTVGQMEALTANLIKAGEMLNTLPLSMQMMSEKVASSFNEVKTIVSSLQTAISQQQSEMSDRMREHMGATVRSITEKVEETMSGLAEQQIIIAETHQRSTKVMEDLISSFSQNMISVQDTIEHQQNEIMSNTKNMIGSMQETAAKQQSEISENMRDQIGATVRTLTEQVEKTMSGIADQQNSMSESHQRSTKEIENLIMSLSQNFAGIQNSVAQQQNEIMSNTKNMIDNMQASATKQQTELDERRRETFERQIADYLQRMTLLSEYQQTALEKTIDKLNASMLSMTEQVEKVMGGIAEKQSGIADVHTRSTREIERLLQLFAQSIANMQVANNESADMLVTINKASENINSSTDSLISLTTNLNTASDNFMKQQSEVVLECEKMQQDSQELIEMLSTALSDSQAMIDGYTKDFETIKAGLKDIFKGISEGLKDYSSTLRESTGEALSEYSEAITKSTNGLKNIAEALTESAEELSDDIDKLKRMK